MPIRRGAHGYPRALFAWAAPRSQTTPTASPLGAPSATRLLKAMLRTGTVDRTPGAGLLPPDWMDAELVGRALRAASRASAMSLGYGDALGVPELRRALARKLAEIGMPEDPDAIITATGATQALDLVANCLVKPGDVVLVDAPGFFLRTYSLIRGLTEA